MGYHINFRGDMFVDPPLSSNHREVLEYIFNPDQKKQDVFFQVPALPPSLTEILHQHGDLGNEFVMNAEGTVIEAVGEESSYDAGTMEKFWKQIVEHVLPDYALNGHLEWDASSSNDGSGILWICGKQVEAVLDVISNPGPSWEREE
jgi:hypothetical protein